jgi:uncharacterized membrane protein YkoI
MKRKHYLAAIAALSASAIGSAYAAQAAENDAVAVESAKIGLAQAVIAAEQHGGGKASRAEFEKSRGRWVFDVEVVAGKKVMDVKVDPSSGKVLAATEDKADRDDANDAED